MATSESARIDRKPHADFTTSLFQKYAGQLLRYLDRRLGVLQDAEDVAQEVYLQLLQIDSEKEKEIRNPLGFLYGIASRVLADHLSAARRERHRLPSAGEVSEIGLDQISEALADRLEECLDIEQQIGQALARLPPMKAAVLILHHRDGMTREQVARELNLSPDTVKKYIVQGHMAIRMKSYK